MLNRPVRTRLQGGVGGGIREDSPYPDYKELIALTHRLIELAKQLYLP
jgi:hypothetical protein